MLGGWVGRGGRRRGRGSAQVWSNLCPRLRRPRQRAHVGGGRRCAALGPGISMEWGTPNRPKAVQTRPRLVGGSPWFVKRTWMSMWERGRRGDSGHIAGRVAGSFKKSRSVLVVASCNSAALQLWQRGPVGPGRPGRRGSWASSRARHPVPSQGGGGGLARMDRALPGGPQTRVRRILRAPAGSTPIWDIVRGCTRGTWP